jgi:murein DD-endopeptidase MepM/ murein hydrolase activator NlpD
MKTLLFFFLQINLASASNVEAILVHPLFEKRYACSEHSVGELASPGDALGADCVVKEFSEESGRGWYRSYKDKGLKNEDWYAWQKNVLAPVDGKVVKVNLNPITNVPGIMGKGPSTSITIKRDDGVNVILAHLDGISVKVGEKIKAGQPVARVGNNGFSRHPHVHIGAWKGNTPLQIRFDQRKIIIE